MAVCDSTQQYRPKNILQEPKLIFIGDNEMHISAVWLRVHLGFGFN
jgi:hypothetical protein